MARLASVVMGWLEAVVTILKAWAWPVVVLVAVLMLRRELAALFTRVSRFAAPGLEAEFKHEVAATSELAEAAASEPPDELPTPGEPSDHTLPTRWELFEEASRGSPIAAIVRAWNLIEYLLPPDETGSRSIPIRLKRLGESGVLSDEMSALGRRLFGLRSQVVHGVVVPDAADADNFVSAAWTLATELSKHTGQVIRPK